MKIVDVFLALVFTFIWGLNFVVVSFGLASFPPLLFSALRFLLAAFPAVLLVKRGPITWKAIIQIGVSLGVIHYSFLYLGLNIGMPPGLSSLVVQIHVVFTVLLSTFILQDRPSVLQIVGMVVSTSGIALLVVDRYQATNFFGLVLIICAGASLAFANILIKLSKIANMLHLMVWVSIVPPLPLLAVSLIFETGQLDALKNVSWTGIGAVLYASFLATLLATAISGRLFREYSANVVAPFFLLVPVFGMLSSFVILGETLSLIEILASCLVLAGLILIVFGVRAVDGAPRNEPAR